MTDENGLIAELRSERAQWESNGETRTWSSQCDGVAVTVHVLDFDRFGYLLDEVSVKAGQPVSQKQMETLTSRVTYLIEKLNMVEWSDTEGGLLRSDPIEMDRSAREYFEIAIRQPGNLTLRRYAFGPQRVRVLFHLTERQLGRLFEDLTESLRGD